MSTFLSSRHDNDSDTTRYGDRITHNKHLSSQEESFFFKVSNNKTHLTRKGQVDTVVSRTFQTRGRCSLVR